MSSKENIHLKNLRIQHGYTQEQVAERLGVTKATISKYEKGQRHIKGEYIEKLAELFSVEPIYILTGKTSEDFRKRAEEDMAAATQEEREYWESVLLTDRVMELMPLLDKLNEDGQRKAVERVSELAEIPKYQAR